ncbi:MAG: tyrosine-type recombinase/integrase [Clostridia bacterium]|nr:tyrosine-type recombinase/integrase [Clostridia bacterium]
MTTYIRKRNNKNGKAYQVVVDLGKDVTTGKRKREFRSFSTLAEAKRYQAHCQGQLYVNGYVAKSNITVQTVADEWFASVKASLKPTSARGYKVNINNHIVPHIGSVPIQYLRSTAIKVMIASLEKQLSATSIKYVLRNLSQILKYAEQQSYIVKNPMKYVPIPKSGKPKFLTYSVEEMAKLIKSVKGTAMELPILIEAETGLRLGELLGLSWDNINLEKMTITVNKTVSYVEGKIYITSPKTTKSNREIVVSATLIEAIKSYKEKEESTKRPKGYENKNNLLFHKENGQPLTNSSFSSKFASTLKKNGLKHIRFHDLRHTHASLLYNKYGMNIKSVSDRLGHSKVSTTMDYYVGGTGDIQKAGIEKLAKDLNSLERTA